VEIKIRQAAKEDGKYIATHIREVDKREIWASSRSTPTAAIQIFLAQKECYCALIDDIPAIIFGCAGGVLGLLATDDINKISVRFVRGSKVYIQKWLAQYGYLFNFVHAYNKVSIKWLKWLGFTIGDMYIFNEEPFYKFEQKR